MNRTATAIPLWVCDTNLPAIDRSTTLVPGQNNELRAKIDLDEGRPNNRGTNHFFFRMKKTVALEFAPLMAYLQGKMGWDNSVLECMSRSSHRLPFYPSGGTNHYRA